MEALPLTKEDVVTAPQHYVFRNVGFLFLSCFHDEDDAFPSDFLLQSFPKQVLVVSCSSFKEIFPEDASGSGGAVVSCGGLTDVQRPLTSLGNLKRLNLQKLGNVRRLWRDGSLMSELLNQIEYLYVEECPSLSIVLPSPTSFQSLVLLYVNNCPGLVHVGTCSAVTSLTHLVQLTIKDCGAMEDVVTDDGEGADEISFPELEQLMLDGLPSLESFSLMNGAFRFPSLVRVVVMRCPKMNIFCNGALTTPNLDRVLLSEEDDEGPWEGDLNTTIQTLSA